MGSNILKIQNQGNILSNLRLLYEMKNAGDDLHDKHGYFTKKDVARIAVMSLMMKAQNLPTTAMLTNCLSTLMMMLYQKPITPFFRT